MSAWLLLVSLLASDLRPHGDGDRALDHYRWSLCRKLLQMTPRGPEIFQTQTEHQCTCIRRKCVCDAVRHRLRTSPFYWTHRARDDRSHIPALVVSLLPGKGKRVPAFLLRSDAPPALHVVRETSHIAMDVIKGRPDSWTLHHHTAALGHSFQAFLPEKSKRRAPDAIFQTQKMLTKRYRTAAAVIIPCCFKAGEMRSAMNVEKMSKEQLARAQRRQKESERRPRDIKVHMKYDRKAAVRQQDVSRAAALRSGSSAMMKSSNTISQLKIQRNSARTMKKNEHLNLNWLLKRTPKQLPLKAASSVSDDDDDDDDGFYVERRLLLPSREKTGSIHRPQSNIKATQDANKVDFNEETITQRAERRRQEGERPQTNTNANANQRRLAYILQAYFTHETNNNVVDTKQVLTEAGEDVLIMLFLPDTDREKQTSCLNTDTGWEAVKTHTKLMYDPPPMTKVVKERFIIEPESLKESLFSLEMYVAGGTERIDIKPAERRAGVSDSTEERVKETEEERRAENNHLPRENMGINHTKQEENAASDESVTPSPPSLKMTERGTAKTEERAAETVNTEMKETTSSTEAFTRGGPHNADRLPSTGTPGTRTGAEPRFIKWQTGSGEVPVEKSFSGLRMREEDVPAETSDRSGETGARAATNGPEPDGKVVQNDARVNSVTFAKRLPTIQELAEDTLPKTASLCRGLIHRTEAGWKHCAERAAGTASKMFSTDALKHTGEQEKEHIRDQSDKLLNHDELDHFYYFDGVLRRVRNNFYPYYKRRRRRKRSPGNTENSVFRVRNKGDNRENVLSYI